MSLGAIFVLMSLLYGSAYTFPALVPLVAAEFGASRVVVGGAFGVYLMVIAAAGPLAGGVVDRGGRRAIRRR
jgi:MFS family permease